jgi:hypothetical protein
MAVISVAGTSVEVGSGVSSAAVAVAGAAVPSSGVGLAVLGMGVELSAAAGRPVRSAWEVRVIIVGRYSCGRGVRRSGIAKAEQPLAHKEKSERRMKPRILR